MSRDQGMEGRRETQEEREHSASIWRHEEREAVDAACAALHSPQVPGVPVEGELYAIAEEVMQYGRELEDRVRWEERDGDGEPPEMRSPLDAARRIAALLRAPVAPSEEEGCICDGDRECLHHAKERLAAGASPSGLPEIRDPEVRRASGRVLEKNSRAAGASPSPSLDLRREVEAFVAERGRAMVTPDPEFNDEEFPICGECGADWPEDAAPDHDTMCFVGRFARTLADKAATLAVNGQSAMTPGQTEGHSEAATLNQWEEHQIRQQIAQDGGEWTAEAATRDEGEVGNDD